ncbi:hypothetical protein D3C87_1159870 [compost metagenome]
METRQRPDAMRAEELGFVQHARQNAAHFLLVDGRQHPPVDDARSLGQMRVGGQIAVALQKQARACPEIGQSGEYVLFKHGNGGKRKQSDDRTHLQTHGATVRQAQHVIEESIFLVPGFVLVLADAVQRASDQQRVLEKLLDKLFIEGFVQREFDGDAQHLLAEKHHPGRPVGLVQIATRGQGRRTVEHSDIVESQKASLEDIGAGPVLAIDPPCEVHQ